jgi:hypothetical protein
VFFPALYSSCLPRTLNVGKILVPLKSFLVISCFRLVPSSASYTAINPPFAAGTRIMI